MKKLLTQHFGNEDAKHLATYEKLGGYKALRKAVRMQPRQIIDEVKAGNLRGRGGAGFPAGVKWGFVPKDAETVYLVVNADEGEPGTYKDRWLMTWDPHRLIEGCCIAGYAIRSHKVFIYIRGELHHVADILDQAVQEAYDRRVLGTSMVGSGWAMDMVVHRGAGAYICGEETSLLNSLEGRRGYPRLKPPFPAIRGAFGQPTVVNNVETLMSVPSIIEMGGAAYAELGCEGEGGTRCLAISGHVKNPGVYEVPCGINLRTIIDEVAGGMRDPNKPLKGVIPGGSSMPVLLPHECDVPYSVDGLGKSEKIQEVEQALGEVFRWAGGTLRSSPGSGAIVVMEEGTDMVAACARIMRFYAHESCGQCTPCREGSGWIAAVCTRLARGEGRPGDIDRLFGAARQIGGNTICALGDAVTWPMLGFLTKFRGEFEARLAESRVAAAS
ncbi:MAG: NADH-quinone oxidoreductase subunit NuoF [Proteobacteria bacterium]|nr:MAG: NADH-quinone oxidoreductase subunit NuoF [Pseudomonadota bacterium]